MSYPKKILALLLCAVVLIGIVPTSAIAAETNGLDNFKKVNTYETGTFSDVSPSDWYYDNVKAAYELGLMIGQGENFGVDSDVTVAETVTLAARLHSIYSGDNESFAQGTPWYQVYVDYVTSKNLVSLSGLDMTAPATRAQYANILGAALPDEALESVNNVADDAIPDVKIGDTYASAIYRLYRAGILTGNDDQGTYAPNTNIKRREVAAIVTRMSDTSLRRTITLGDFYTVTFNLNYNNSPNQTVSVEAGKAVTAPSNPTRGGYTFSGWYTAASGGTRFDFSTKITSDITLYAHWSAASSGGGGGGGGYTPRPTTYTVTFNSNGGSAVASQSVIRGGTVTIPETPTRANYVFDAWYSDSELKIKFDFSSEVSSNITLYAGWISSTDNLSDDMIDYGDVTEMMSRGDINVIFGPDGDVRTIDGQFTDVTIGNVTDAATVLNNASPLFGGEGVFQVDESNISMQTTGVVSGQTNETFFRYTPSVNNISVLGSQIIISTDEDGHASGLFSSYNDLLQYADTTPSITMDEAKAEALTNLLDTESLSDYIEELAQNDINNDVDDYRVAFSNALTAESELFLYDIDSSTIPILVYAVHYDNCYKIDEDVALIGIIDDGSISTDEIAVGEEDQMSNNISALLPSIDCTYYVYANGEHAGEIFRVIENTEGASTYSVNANDLKGTSRTFYALGENGTYWLKDTTRNLETYKTTFGGFLWTQPQLPGELVTFTNRIDKTAVSAHANMAAVYDFYKNVLGRDSFDGHGKKIVVSYDYDDINLIFTGNYYNAFWSSSLQQMVFGDDGNFAAALDVAGHEFTHAVINYIVGDGTSAHSLTYYGESGALNEAYADIMGCLIEGKSGNDKWLIAEDSDRALRSMSSPSTYGDPEHYDNRYTGTGDHAGVHTNSSIFNFAAYKMMVDSRTSSVTRNEWARVFYRSLYRLTENATFLDARGAVIASAKALGFSESQQQAIKDAFDAVGITEPDSIRIVLRWGETPSDLDSHLVGPGVTGDRFHTAFYQRNYYTDGTYDDYSTYGSKQYAVDLDYDDTTSYGPEVTTIHTLTPGEYYFFVHDYSNGSSETSTEMASSGATVNVYRGSNGTPINGGTFTVSTSSSGTIWNVFKLTIGADKRISIEPINTYGSVETYS